MNSPKIFLEDMKTWPTLQSLWQHRNGNVYRVLMFTNVETDRQREYPTTIVYQNIKSGNRYSRRLIDWDRSMAPKKP